MASDNHLGVDLSTFAPEDVAERIREHLGDYESSRVDVDAVTGAVREFFKLKDRNERSAALSALGAFFCTECGSGYLPCHCWNDE